MATNEDPWKVKIPVKTRPQYDQLMGEPKIDTLSRKLIIGVAPAGIFLDKDAFPAVPSNPKEIIAAAKECYEAGAALIHIHCKNEDGYNDYCALDKDSKEVSRTDCGPDVCESHTQMDPAVKEFVTDLNSVDVFVGTSL